MKVKICKQCKKEVSSLSRKKLCYHCSLDNMYDAIFAMQHKTGERYKKWVKAVEKASTKNEWN